MIINITSNIYELFFKGSSSIKKTLRLLNRPLSLGGHVESQEKQALFLHGKPRSEFASGRDLPC